MLLVAINLKYGITRFWENWDLQGMSHNVKLSVLECVNAVFYLITNYINYNWNYFQLNREIGLIKQPSKDARFALMSARNSPSKHGIIMY